MQACMHVRTDTYTHPCIHPWIHTNLDDLHRLKLAKDMFQ